MPNKPESWNEHGGPREADGTSSARVIPFPACQSFPASAVPSPLSSEDAARLEALRWWLLKSRLASKAKLDEACFLLAAERDAPAEPYALALFGTLARGARREMIFYRPGIEDCSEDEQWLLRLLRALRRGDEAGSRALVAWRVTPPCQRRISFLADRLAFFMQNDLAKSRPPTK